MESANHVQNVVEYDLYPHFGPGSRNETEIRSFLEERREIFISQLSPLLVNYIWQRDPFNITPVIPTGSDCPPHLHGVTNFGDNVDDEWFIVYLLYELTTSFPGLVASIQDNDGQFLLIEAAHHLPKWLEPDTSVNRVFIHEGDLHIIPKPNSPGDVIVFPAGVPSKSHAVQSVRNHAQRTLAEEHIRGVVKDRIEGFPVKVHSSFHHTHCLVPARLAPLLMHQPGLVAPAVDAFYQRDPLDLKACRVMKHFPPENLVTTQVRFTRCLYAQLAQQPFQPDRRSGWKLPHPSSSKFKPSDLGMKLAHGFEILCARYQGNKKDINQPMMETLNPDDVAVGARWQKYLRSLINNGFFRGELEGSKLYKELLGSAKKFFAETVVTSPQNDRPSCEPGQRILHLLKTMPCDLEQLREEEKRLPPPDSDSWMDLSLDELDSMIARASGKAAVSSAADSKRTPSSIQEHRDDSDNMNFDPSRVTETLKTFVDSISGLKGVEFPEGAGKGDIDFDADEFENAMRNILDFRDTEKPEDDSDSDLMSDKDYQSGDDTDEDTEDIPPGDDGSRDDERMRELMEQMDRELAVTEVGKSFERDMHIDDDQEPMHSRMDQPIKQNGMDATGPSHLQAGRGVEQEMEGEEVGDDSDAYRPVEVDLNLLKNILESYSSQQGLAGPASNILHSMGVHVPMNADEDDR